ncbi:MAG: aminotransferase class I/II-fold pyridoxal phosphate-dependent enzyme [Verrucomicrobiota bacterium]
MTTPAPDIKDLDNLDAASCDSGSFVANHVQNIPRSGIRDFFELVQGRPDVISLGVGEPDFSTPWHIREATIYALEQGKTSYTSNLGLLSLRKEISRYMAKHFAVEYNSDKEIIVTVGVSEAVDLALRALINPGDEVIYHQPCYVSYHPGIALAHGNPVPVPTTVDDHFALTADSLAKVITPQSKVLLLNFPSNPTGATLPRQEQEKIARLCSQHNLIVISDEIYAELTYEGQHTSIASLPGMKERTILLHGLSKAYAMTGYRIGFACAAPEIIEAMMRVHQYSMLCASIIAQEAAIEALANGQEAMLRMKESFYERRNFIVYHFNRIGLTCLKPQGAFYAFPDITKSGLSSKDFAHRLVDQENVAVVPGTAFGNEGEGFVRCSYATSMDLLQSAVERMERFMASL